MTDTHDEEDLEATLDIAIVGMSCRFPGAPDLDSFWSMLQGGREGIAFFSDEELAQRGVPLGRRRSDGFVPAAPVLDDMDRFDAEFFGYSPGDASMLDPQHRIFLECAWHALEHAGHAAGRGVGQVGVFAGTSLSTYLLFNLLHRNEIAEADDTFPAMVANDKDFLSTRLSYHLNLDGPSIDVQTGCSTSLVATHLACQSLLTFQCDLALAGGVSVHMPQRAGYIHTPGGIGSVDGHCRPYDADGTGTIFGSGVGVVALRRLADALADGDQVFAVIKGTAINNDGNRKVGYTAPSVDGQVDVLRRALAVAGVDSAEIAFVEGHGTATSLGDPVEVAALNVVFGDSHRGHGTCALGSVKSNIGHLDAAAGVAGLIKAALSVAHGRIPPTLHYRRPNPKVLWDEGPFFVNAETMAWPEGVSHRVAGVSAFGIGGTNAHAILGEAPPRAPSCASSRAAHLLVLSTRDEDVLDVASERLAEHLEKHPDLSLADVAWTLQEGRVPMKYRRVVVASSPAEAVVRLRSGEESGRPRSAVAIVPEGAPRKLALMFPGGGAQYVGMGADLYAHEPIYRRAFDTCARLVATHRQIDIVAATLGADAVASGRLTRPSVALPALFAVEYSLAQLYLGLGLDVAAMAGHSMGEYVAACLCGVFSLEDALELVCERGRLFETLPGGAMVSVPMSEEEIRPYLGEGLSIAAINGPKNCVLAGTVAAVEAACVALETSEIDVRRIPIDVAAHSPMVEPILDELRAFVSRMKLGTPSRPFVSGVTGTWIKAAEATDPAYWARHLRATVRFHDVLRTLLNDSAMVLLEVGPGRTLCSAALPCVEASRRAAVVSSMRSRRDDSDDVSEWMMAWGRLWLAGIEVPWSKLWAEEPRRRVALPGYAFRRDRFWLEPQVEQGARNGLTKHPEPSAWRYAPSWIRAPRVSVGALPGGHAIVCGSAQDGGASAAIGEAMRVQGLTVHHVVEGTTFEQRDQDFTLPANDRAAYTRLLAAIGERPTVVAHTLAAKVGGAGDCVIDAFLSPLYLAQALEEQEGEGTVPLLMVARGVASVLGSETLHPGRALALGPCRVIALETDRVRPRLIDVGDDDAVEPQELAHRVVAEWCAQESVVALRGVHRWTEAFRPLPVVSATATTELRPRGVYLITGGLGDLGLAIAADLAQHVGARLLLFGRSALPERERWAQWCDEHEPSDVVARRIRAIERIETLGGEVIVAQGDVADADALRRAVESVRRSWGRVDGVFHAAGVAAAGPFQLKTPEQVRSVLRAKVDGLATVQAVLDAWAPEAALLVLFSSRTAVLGDVGQLEHCAANAVFDAVAQANAQRPGCRTVVSINWDTWRDIGQAVTTDVPGPLVAMRAELLAHAMSTPEALAVWRDALASGEPQVIVSTQHLPTVAQNHRARMRDLLTRIATVAPVRRRSTERYVAPRTQLEETLAAIWGELLGVTEVGVEDNFFDLGGNSLLALAVIRAVRTRTGRELTPVSIFEAPTVARLTRVLGEGEQGGTVVAMDQRRDRGARRRDRRRGTKTRELA